MKDSSLIPLLLFT